MKRRIGSILSNETVSRIWLKGLQRSILIERAKPLSRIHSEPLHLSKKTVLGVFGMFQEIIIAPKLFEALLTGKPVIFTKPDGTKLSIHLDVEFSEIENLVRKQKIEYEKSEW